MNAKFIEMTDGAPTTSNYYIPEDFDYIVYSSKYWLNKLSENQFRK